MCIKMLKTFLKISLITGSAPADFYGEKGEAKEPNPNNSVSKH